MVNPTLLLKSEVEVVELMSSPLGPTLSSKSVKTEVVSLTKFSSCSSISVESELNLLKFLCFVPIVLDKRIFCLFQQNPL